MILDKVYELASRGSQYFELDVQGTSVDAMAEHLWALLEHTTGKGDFTEVLSTDRTFMCEYLYFSLL